MRKSMGTFQMWASGLTDQTVDEMIKTDAFKSTPGSRKYNTEISRYRNTVLEAVLSTRTVCLSITINFMHIKNYPTSTPHLHKVVFAPAFQGPPVLEEITQSLEGNEKEMKMQFNGTEWEFSPAIWDEVYPEVHPDIIQRGKKLLKTKLDVPIN
ncbi:hypothetical protein P167DRAFT_610081 [Morchella conica CCBAS932]|uniref:Uncharacterized protein n=1 Tax=Morchella conica CCBAS932 TaxID=1392247 RepID=A0A3N4KDF8_9PEZI|nr:hypothetical protein P167DRAFT_610081 [Morchella conica CCBAS932]